MNNKFLYAKSISLENILKLLFNKPEIERVTKLNLLLQFNIVEHVNQQNFNDYFLYSYNYFDCISFNLNEDENLTLAFIYNKEKQKFEMAISTNKDLENRDLEELFDKLLYKLQNTKYYYLYQVNGYYVSDCERLKILQYLKNIAEMEYNDGFMVFYPELIDIQSLIIETFESNCINDNSCKGVL